jgi:WXG100 family type VII secretion target
MITDGFLANTETMDQKARQVAELVPRIQKQLSQLNTQMQQMFGRWEGRSSTGFRNLHGNWNRQYLQLNRKLDTIGRNLATNSRTYVGADDNSMPTAAAGVPDAGASAAANPVA